MVSRVRKSLRQVVPPSSMPPNIQAQLLSLPRGTVQESPRMALEMVLHERRVWFLHLRLTFYAWLGYVELFKKRSASPFVFWLFRQVWRLKPGISCPPNST